ncbi:MAG: protease modulator HflK [Lentisphaeria bacterium]
MNNSAPHNQSPSPHPEAGRGAESVVRMLRHLFSALRILIVVVIVFTFFQGVFVVREQEQAMLFRFGRLVAKDGEEILGSGWYWAWPYPVDEVKTIPAERSVTLETNHFWRRSDAARLRGEDQAAAGEGLIPGRDGYLLAGDANIVHMVAKITFRITNAKKYYLDFYEGKTADIGVTGTDMISSEAAEEVIRSCLENAILKETAAWSVDNVIKRSRAGGDQGGMPGRGDYLSNAIQQRTEKLLVEMDMGIEVEKVNLANVQPPAATADAFQQVNDAIQKQDTLLKSAQTYENRALNAAESTKARILVDAEAYRKRVLSSVQADLDYFKQVLGEYEDNPATMLVAIYTDTIRDVLRQVKERYIIHARKDGHQEVRLLLGRQPERDRNQPDTKRARNP